VIGSGEPPGENGSAYAQPASAQIDSPAFRGVFNQACHSR